VCTLGANVLVNALILKLLADVEFAIQLAFLLATGASASLNFVGMKFFVFRPIPSPELQ
jgi:putative flippase GtrA